MCILVSQSLKNDPLFLLFFFFLSFFLSFFLKSVIANQCQDRALSRNWANVVVDLRVEIALHVVFLVVPIVRACPAVWGIGDLHQTAVVEEEPCPSAVGSKDLTAVKLVKEEAFDRLGRLIEALR